MRDLKKIKPLRDTFVAITSCFQDLYQQHIAYHIRI